jgi:hypothetical protein
MQPLKLGGTIVDSQTKSGKLPSACISLVQKWASLKLVSRQTKRARFAPRPSLS